MGGVMRIRICIVLIGVAAVLADVDEPLSRQKRFAVQNCQITPDNTVDKVIEKGQTAKLTCNLDSSVQVFFIPGNGNYCSRLIISGWQCCRNCFRYLTYPGKGTYKHLD